MSATCLRVQQAPACSGRRMELSTSFVRAPASVSSMTAVLPSTRTTGTATRRVTCMAAKVSKIIKLALPAGKANPSPPVGPALGAAGVNIMGFCKEYNAATQDKVGQVIPVVITVYEDRSFTFILKTPPASELIKQAAKIQRGSGDPSKTKVGSITQDQLKEIASIKLPDLNCTSMESAMRIVEGTCRNMGVTVEA